MTATEHLPEPFYVEDGIVIFRPKGEVSIEGLTELVDDAIETCRKAGVKGFVADLCDLRGFPVPSAVDRLLAISQWAATSDSRVAVAVVISEDKVDPEKLGVLIAKNRGMDAEVFSYRHEAMAWVRERIKAKG